MIGNFDRADIRERHARVFRLSASITAGQMRIAKQSSACVTKHLLRHPRVWIRVFTEGKHLFPAEETTAASNRKRHHYAVADLKIGYFTTNLDDLTHEFMTENIAALHRRNESVVKVQI